MKTIYKYQILMRCGIQEVVMPVGSEIIKVGIQRGNICIWAIVSQDEKEMESHKISIYSTGDTTNISLYPHKYLDTLFDDVFVWHVFQVGTVKIS